MIARSTILPVVLCVLIAATVGAADRGAELYETARGAYWKLSEDGPEARAAENWRATAEGFRRVAVAAPGSAKADDALYMVGLCLERAHALSAAQQDEIAALTAYDHLAVDYSRSNLADDALLRAGRMLEAKGDEAGARGYYRRVLREVPAGDMASLAQRRLDQFGSQIVVEGVRHWSGADYTRVVVDLSDSTPFAARDLPADRAAGKPHRIFIDFQRASIAPDCPAGARVSDGLVRRVRAGQHDRETARVVLDLEAPTTFRVFPLDGPARLVVDVFRAKGRSDVIGSLLAGSKRPEPPAKRLRIVLDPGHGGKDPGAVGPNGLKEKDVTLTIAREMHLALRAVLPCDVKLTRDRDVYLSLEQRTAIANAFGADLFVSVHVNANRSTRAKGIETYYLDRGSDRAARRLAARENDSSEAGVAEIEHVLGDVLLTSKIRESRRLARAVQRALVAGIAKAYGSTRDLGVKRGPFYVLTGAVMPAVLVEASFITNPVESKRLRETAFLRATARAMAQGVEHFVEGG